MKRSTVLEAFRFVNGIKMNVVSDKETRSALISNHLKMYKIVEKHEEEVKKIYEKLFEGKEEEMQRLYSLRAEYNNGASVERQGEIVEDISKNYTELIKLENEFNETFAKLADEEIDVVLVKMDEVEFVSAVVDSQIEFTMSEMAKLSELFKTSEDTQE